MEVVFLLANLGEEGLNFHLHKKIKNPLKIHDFMIRNVAISGPGGCWGSQHGLGGGRGGGGPL